MRLSYPSPIYPNRLSRLLTDSEKTSFWIDMIITHSIGSNKKLTPLRMLQDTHPKSNSAYIVSRSLINELQWTVLEANDEFFEEVLIWWKSVANRRVATMRKKAYE